MIWSSICRTSVYLSESMFLGLIVIETLWWQVESYPCTMTWLSFLDNCSLEDAMLWSDPYPVTYSWWSSAYMKRFASLTNILTSALQVRRNFRPHAPTLSPEEWSPTPPLCGLKQIHPTLVRHPRRTRCASMHVNNLIACFRCTLIFGLLLIFLVQVKRKEGILISKRSWSTMRLSCKA